MLDTLIWDLDCHVNATWMIGDSKADVQAARAAGVHSALLFASNRCELCPLREGPSVTPDVSAPTFDTLVDKILDAQTEFDRERQSVLPDDFGSFPPPAR